MMIIYFDKGNLIEKPSKLLGNLEQMILNLKEFTLDSNSLSWET